ncbi:hypothetical protein [Rhizobium ruizarguesonis]|uniref:hypothetical protein n=1 Tax=Rhizobium ruizarguesonis TaxID=2081791 RepID=UPI00102F88DF|nr:hypothetical protein [Rhizobium ruizarguesonis]TBE02299.1 hypothetical protein ELH10_15500 [Rhizobium ruizarguesonis]TBF14675.1 hypothetical protein ELG95_14645 [Rhizobium ruizarguesonis]
MAEPTLNTDFNSEAGNAASAQQIASAKANFPPDMRTGEPKGKANPTTFRMKATLVTVGIAIGSAFGGIVYAADGLVKIEKAWTIVVDKWNDKQGVDKVQAVTDTYNKNTQPLFDVLSPALKQVKPTIDTIVAVKNEPIKRDLFIQSRQMNARVALLSKSQFKDSATSLLSEFDTAASCLNGGQCNAAAWHESFDGAFCGAQRTYSDFVDLQRQRLPTFASDFAKVVESIDCAKILYE